MDLRVCFYVISIFLLLPRFSCSFGYKKSHQNRRSKNDTSGSQQVAIFQNLDIFCQIQIGAIDQVLLNVTNASYDETLADFYVEHVSFTARDPRVVNIVNVSFYTLGLMRHANQSNITSNGVLSIANGGEDVDALGVLLAAESIGKTIVDVTIFGYVQDAQEHEKGSKRIKETRLLTSINVSVLRIKLYKHLSFAFTCIVAAITLFTTFLIGTQLDWKIMMREIKKPTSILIAFVVAYFILHGDYSWQLIYLAIGACPGAGNSPFWTMMLDGNLDLAVTMSFVASVAALGILPFWLFTLGRVFFIGQLKIPYTLITLSLCGLLCPIFIGLALKHFRPVWAERVGKIVKHVTFIGFIVAGAFGCGVNSYVFALLDWHHLVCGMLLPWCGLAITYPFARWVCRRTHEDSVAIAVENGCLHVAVPVVLLQLSFTQPDADLSLVVPVGVVMFATWPLWIYLVYLLIKKRSTKAVQPSEDLDEKDVELSLGRKSQCRRRSKAEQCNELSQISKCENAMVTNYDHDARAKL